MKKNLIITLFLLAAFPLATPAQSWKTRKQILNENEALRQEVAQLRQQVDSFRRDRAEISEITAELSGENENKMAFAMTPQDYAPDATDSLLSQWYMHRRTRKYAREGEYDMDSVHFTSNVPDSVLMRRLARLNSFISLPYNETVKNYMILYSEKMPRKMGQILGLCEYYMPIFEETFRRYDLPLELKYVAIIESALNPRAVSWAGATGMWQFMYRTAKNYGLEIDSYVDERMDPFKSADAAARYLRDAYRIFGDWNLAISSYNCGSGNVNKAIKRAGGRRDFWSIYEYLPRETRGYVPAMVGAMYAINYAKEYGLTPDPIQAPVYVDTVHVRKNLHFAQVSELLGIPMDDLRDLNPQYHKDIVPGASGEMVLRLPFNYTSAFLDIQDTVYDHRKAELFNNGKVQDGRSASASKTSATQTRSSSTASTGTSWVYYTVKSGDNLGKIAKRNHTTVKQLKTWNNLRSDNIRAGQKLKVGKR